MLNISYRDDSDADKSVMHEMFIDNVYRLEGYKLSGNNSVVLDIGANIGTFTLQVLKLAYDNDIAIKVYAIEPEKNNLELLKTNLEDNEILLDKGSEVIIIEKGISDYTGKAFITDGAGGSRLSKDKENQEIEIITFDQLMEEVEEDAIDFTKIDIEGSEVPLLLGASKESIVKTHYYAIEYEGDNHDGSIGEILEPFLDDFSFETWGIPNNGCNIYLENHHWEK